MPWTAEEIEREWLGGGSLGPFAEDAVRAFAAAEEVRGRDWVLGSTDQPGGMRIQGFAAVEPIFWFGMQLQAIEGAARSDLLVQRLKDGNADTESELTAIYLLRDHILTRALEIEPSVTVGSSERRPDFRIQGEGGPWTYVEVTRLHRSTASENAQRLIGRIAETIFRIEKPFILEVVLRRSISAPEEEEVVQGVAACQFDNPGRNDIGDLAWVLVKTGQSQIIIPTPIPEDNIPRVAVAHGLAGPGQPNRQIIVKVPFEDQRAEDVLSAEAKQLPRRECGLVMVDVGAQPSAMTSWPTLIPPRFTKAQHTRVVGVLLFSTAITATVEGVRRVCFVKLIPNPHAFRAVPSWLVDHVEAHRAETRRLTKFKD